MKRRLWKLLEGDNVVMPIPDTVILLMIVKICGIFGHYT
jgi:hypothetical protein